MSVCFLKIIYGKTFASFEISFKVFMKRNFCFIFYCLKGTAQMTKNDVHSLFVSRFTLNDSRIITLFIF
jgi:hypothetical protein